MRNPDYSLYLIVLNLIACTKYLLPCYVIYSLILKLGHEHLEEVIFPSTVQSQFIQNLAEVTVCSINFTPRYTSPKK